MFATGHSQKPISCSPSRSLITSLFSFCRRFCLFAFLSPSFVFVTDNFFCHCCRQKPFFRSPSRSLRTSRLLLRLALADVDEVLSKSEKSSFEVKIKFWANHKWIVDISFLKSQSWCWWCGSSLVSILHVVSTASPNPLVCERKVSTWQWISLTLTIDANCCCWNREIREKSNVLLLRSLGLFSFFNICSIICKL